MNTSLHAHRIETTLTQDGTLTLAHLPFQAGETVEVIVLPNTSALPAQDRYLLRGTPVEYLDPLEPVAGPPSPPLIPSAAFWPLPCRNARPRLRSRSRFVV